MVLKAWKFSRQWAVVGAVLAVAILVLVRLSISEDGWSDSWETQAYRSLWKITSACGFDEWKSKFFRKYAESRKNDLEVGVESGKLVVLNFDRPKSGNWGSKAQRILRYGREHRISIASVALARDGSLRVYVESEGSAKVKKFIEQLLEGGSNERE